MKKFILFCLIVLGTTTICRSQNWMTSLEVAKRLAYVQDKMLVMVWEDSSRIPYAVLIEDGNERAVVNLFESDYVNEILWQYFIPVKVSEAMYDGLIRQIEDNRTKEYIDIFDDNSLKVMDINGNILGTASMDFSYLDLAKFIEKYALSTTFLKEELKNYRKQQNFYTTFRLSSKYLDYAIFANSAVRPELVELSAIYLREADQYLLKDDLENKMAFVQKSELLKLKQLLVLNRPKKVIRQLKRIDDSQVFKINESLLAFLHFTAYRLLKDEKNASLWRSKVSFVNLKKAMVLINTKS